MGTLTMPPAADLVIDQSDDPTTATIDLAADIGNARAVILVRAGEQITQIELPSVRSLHGAFSWDVFERRGWPTGSWSRLAADEHIITIDGHERFVGRLAVEFAGAASSGRGSDERYSDGTTRDFLLAGLAAALPKASTIVARCTTLLPISLWAAHASAVEASLKKTHRYSYKGRDVTAKIEWVGVRREGEAAYHALPNRSGGRTLIIDGGGRTVNVALFADGEYRGGDTIDNMGVECALDAVDKELQHTGARRLSYGERIGLLAAMREGQPYQIIAANMRHPVDPLARRHFDAAASALVQELHARVKIGAAEHIHFVGGAAYQRFFGEQVRTLLPVVQLAVEPETRNVFGALATLGGAAKKAKKPR